MDEERYVKLKTVQRYDGSAAVQVWDRACDRVLYMQPEEWQRYASGTDGREEPSGGETAGT